jgi:hypothetical protein
LGILLLHHLQAFCLNPSHVCLYVLLFNDDSSLIITYRQRKISLAGPTAAKTLCHIRNVFTNGHSSSWILDLSIACCKIREYLILTCVQQHLAVWNHYLGGSILMFGWKMYSNETAYFSGPESRICI